MGSLTMIEILLALNLGLTGALFWKFFMNDIAIIELYPQEGDYEE